MRRVGFFVVVVVVFLGGGRKRRWTTHAWLTVAHTDNHVVHAYVIITTLCNHIEFKKKERKESGTKTKSIGISGGRKDFIWKKEEKKKTGADCYILRTGPAKTPS